MLPIWTAIISATVGQILLTRHDLRGLIPCGIALLSLLIALRRGEQGGEAKNERIEAPDTSPTVPAVSSQLWYRRVLRVLLFALALINAVVAVAGAADNTYRWYGVVAWLLAAGLFLAVFWEWDASRNFWGRFGFSRDGWRLSWTALAVIGLMLIGLFFRFWQLDQMPSEMTSDHIEKLLDVHDLVMGKRPIFFVRNTGREPWQFYWTLMLIRLFELDTKFFALKLGTAAIGLITLPGVYLLGRDLFGRSVGLWATLFTAIASWPVILSRVGLRFPLAPAVTAWSLLFLLRGLRDGRRNDFLLLGLTLGIGLHGYTAYRVMPLAVIACWALAFALRPSKLAVERSTLFRNALLTVLIAAVVFIPLGRFSVEHPDDFWRRSVSRMADPSQPMPDGPFATLLENLVNLALMLHWKGDDVWVNTLVDAPILDPLLGGLLLLGLIIVLWRGARQREPIGPLLLLAGVILLLPSALSLAYPMENPSAVRAGGAIPAVMVIAALPVSLGLARGSRTIQPAHHRERSNQGGGREWVLQNGWRALSVLSALALAIAVIGINYRRYFVDYWKQYELNALNTTEIASAIRGFIESGGDPANAWIIAWPYWIDTRGVGIELGNPPWHNVILDPEELEDHGDAVTSASGPYRGRPRFYVLHRQDTETLKRLRALFPDGWSSLYYSKLPGRNFVLFYVPRTAPQSSTHILKGRYAYAP
jgi:hypothetical protein